MAKKESKRLTYTKRVTALSSEISSINRQANNSHQRIEGLDERIHSLSTRITRIRQGNYQVLTHLETEQASLTEMWSTLSSDLRATTRQKIEMIQSQTRNVQKALSRRQQRSNQISSYNVKNLQGFESSLSELRLNLSELQDSVSTTLTPLEKTYQNIDQDLRMAESTVMLVSQASFPWKEGETPIIATKAKDLNNDLEGIITLTNHRFIFEREKEIVLKKRLFIVTEKKVVREVTLDKPIGMVTQLTKGRVGLLKGSGIYIEFTPQNDITEMKFDTKGHEADWMVRGYNFIISGQADEELATITPTSTDPKTPQLVACQICGAPYSEEIYRGQTSVNCKYCGAVIALQ